MSSESLAREKVEERTQNTHPEPGHMAFVMSDETSIVQKLSLILDEKTG